MEFNDFYSILCSSTPEEINAYISSKGKKKMMNAIIFVKNDSDSNLEIQKKENN